MTGLLIFDAAHMQTSAAGIQGAFASAKTSEYPDVHDCGSGLVADTLDFFLDKLTTALRKSDRYAERIATAIGETADDFVVTENGNLQTVQNLVDSLKDLLPDD